MIVLCFDLETTGLPLKRKGLIHDDKNWPYIVQFAWILFDMESMEPINIQNNIIKLRNNKEIPVESTKIHGITNEMMNKSGIDILPVLKSFICDLKKTNYLVSHNMDFDWKITTVEFYRNKLFENIKMSNHGVIPYCTMKYGKSLYRFRSKVNGRLIKKYPKLIELHTLLFNCELNNDALHDALCDTLVCLRCFYKMLMDRDILKETKLSSITDVFKK